MPQVIRVASRLFNRPLMVMPGTAEAIASNLAERWGVDPMLEVMVSDDGNEYDRDGKERPAPRASLFGEPVSFNGSYRAHFYRSGASAIIPIQGELVNRGAWIGASSGLTSYEGIKSQISTAVADPRVEAIILDMESPGGEATGAFEAADFVRTMAAKKPIIAVVNGLAASAGYALAAGATKIIAGKSSVLGSIGVVMLHVDQSEMLAKKGVKPTLIFAGAHKVDGNPFEPLSDKVHASLQAEVMTFYATFVESVAAMRGISERDVRATEAKTFLGEEAVKLGLADELGTIEGIVSTFSASGRASRLQPRSKGDIFMSEDKQGVQATDAPKTVEPEKEETTPPAPAAKPEPAPVAEPSASAERDRIKAIQTHASAAAFPKLSAFLAFDTALSADVAGKIIEQAALDRPAAAGASYSERKQATGALGFKEPAATKPDAAKDGWKAATDAVNKQRKF